MIQEQLNNFALLGAEWVLYVLVALSVLCVVIAFDRLVYGLTSRTPEGSLMGALQVYLDGGSASALLDALKNMKGVEARVLSAGLEAGIRGGAASARAALDGTTTNERSKMDQRLIVLGTVGSNAPFVGLLGTVIGIIQAFHDLALDSEEGATAVMAGISEALVATAVGLLVAIPAVVLYNWFQRTNKGRLSRLAYLSDMLMSRLHDRKPTET